MKKRKKSVEKLLEEIVKNFHSEMILSEVIRDFLRMKKILCRTPMTCEC